MQVWIIHTWIHPKHRSWQWLHLASVADQNLQGCFSCSQKISVWWNRTGPGDGPCDIAEPLGTLCRCSYEPVFRPLLNNPVQRTALPDVRAGENYKPPAHYYYYYYWHSVIWQIESNVHCTVMHTRRVLLNINQNLILVVKYRKFYSLVKHERNML